jgi:hypothetical protein
LAASHDRTGECLGQEAIGEHFLARPGPGISVVFNASGTCIRPNSQTQKRFAAGAPLAVWYERDKPSHAVLNPAYAWDAAWVWCLFLILIAMGNLELIRRVRRTRNMMVKLASGAKSRPLP